MLLRSLSYGTPVTHSEVLLAPLIDINEFSKSPSTKFDLVFISTFVDECSVFIKLSRQSRVTLLLARTALSFILHDSAGDKSWRFVRKFLHCSFFRSSNSPEPRCCRVPVPLDCSSNDTETPGNCFPSLRQESSQFSTGRGLASPWAVDGSTYE